MNPRLRPIQAFPMVRQGQPALLLRDPLRLTKGVLVISQQLAPALALMDGTRNLDELRAALMIRAGLRCSQSDLEQFVDQLDRALMLHNERFLEACDAALARYHQAPHRPPSSAGGSYPSDPDELAAMLDSYLAESIPSAHSASDGAAPFKGRGLVSPHIDYERGGVVYAQVWKRATDAAREAEVAVIWGTDHNGGEGTLTLTRQHYATPYGVLPTATGVVDAVTDAIGPELAFEEELHHISEHSIELVAVWLHHVRERQPIELVPILCGSFHHFISTPYEPASDPTFTRAMRALKEALDGRSALVVAAGDLAHVGPAFGDAIPVDFARRARLAAADDALIETICAGDAEVFYRQIEAENDRRNVCGLAPIYFTLRLLGETTGERAGYERCPADQNGTSWVSVCGVVLR
jgi:AmmeMemoRadiSam system protein B